MPLLGLAVTDPLPIGELCRIWGYTHEEHVVLTKDGYLLGLHRLPAKKNDSSRSFAGRSTGNPVVYLHHGLLMNSEVWICLTEEERALPFVLVEQGYDVWLGNNRYGVPKLVMEPFMDELFSGGINTPRRASTIALTRLHSGITGLLDPDHLMTWPTNLSSQH